MVRSRRLVAVLATSSVFLLGGCTGTEILNPDFLAALGVTGGSAASLPGDAPAVRISLENRTSRVITGQVSYRMGTDEVLTFIDTIGGGQTSSQAIGCPVTEITLGDISNLSRVGAIVRLGNGGNNDPYIEVEPFGAILKEGQNYDCGDSVSFAVVPSTATRSGYQVFAFIQRAN